MKTIIDQAGREDLRDIVILIAEDEAGFHPDTPEAYDEATYGAAFDAVDSDPRNELYVARSGDRVTGTMQITFIPHIFDHGCERALVEALFVAREARGKGIGGMLLEFACERARKRGCTMVELHSNKSRRDARRFYERHGFEATHEGMKRGL